MELNRKEEVINSKKCYLISIYIGDIVKEEKKV